MSKHDTNTQKKQEKQPNMIEVRNLVKHYGHIRAVDGVSFVARDGQVTGLLGPNGAGKTLRMCY